MLGLFASVPARAHSHVGDVIPMPLFQPIDGRDPFGLTVPPITPVGPVPYPEPATLGLLLVAASCVRPRRTRPPRGG